MTGAYTILAEGAQGGDPVGGANGCLGASIQGVFALNAGDTLAILVGERPASSALPSGGGGSFVALGSSFTSATPLIVAGGGGGQWSSDTPPNSCGGQISELGAGAYPGGAGQGALQAPCGGGGGGFFSSGGQDSLHSFLGGRGFRLGGQGARPPPTASPTSYSAGGFGGGATANFEGSCWVVAGAAGGYSGGSGYPAGTPSKVYGNGGGSYNSGALQRNFASIHSGNGSVTILG